MSITHVIVFCFIGLASSNVVEKPRSFNASCEEPVTHYLELGCKPIYSKRNGMCPMRYECPFMERTADPNKCYYKSKQYEKGERIGENVIDHSCSADCLCRESNQEGTKVSLSCAQVECPDLFYPEEKRECVQQYKMSDCCSYNEICDKEAISKLKSCDWEGRTYREGEVIYPNDSCKRCLCSKNFDGTLNSLECSKINCGIEIYGSSRIGDKCAPIFLEGRSCCPIGWQCGDEEYKIQSTSLHKSHEPEMKCVFDDKNLDVGDKVTINDGCVTCSCNIPPLVTCVRSLNC